MRTLLQFVLVSALAATTAWADLQVQFPPDGPLSPVSVDASGSRVSSMGGALVLDVKAALVLKNTSAQRLRAVALLVAAEELTAGGKASVTVPSLDVGPGETFPLRIDLRLLRPRAGLNAPVRVMLDGVLFDSLAFYGPNKLNSRRAMLAWELEARRDRKYFLDALRRNPDALRQEMVASLTRQDTDPRLDVQLSRGRPAAAGAQTMQVAALRVPDSPVEILSGTAEVGDRELRHPRLEIANRSQKPIRHLDIAWVVRDTAGREFRGGATPSTVALPAGEKRAVEELLSMRFPVDLGGASSYISAVEYEDGSVWVPARRVRGASPEEQRLAEIYRRKGLDALIVELKKFQ